jgi:hypothetical protein
MTSCGFQLTGALSPRDTEHKIRGACEVGTCFCRRFSSVLILPRYVQNYFHITNDSVARSRELTGDDGMSRRNVSP